VDKGWAHGAMGFAWKIWSKAHSVDLKQEKEWVELNHKPMN
jgi:hypothetical protein